MELLNGKAKKLFELWYLSNHKHYDKLTVFDEGKLNQFYRLPEVIKNALIIEWLDSINIAIIIRPKNIKSWDYEVHDFKNIDYVFDCEFESRQQATVEAIKKAVELINESNGK